MHTSRGSGKDSPVPGEGLHGGQPTVTLHETHLHIVYVGRELVCLTYTAHIPPAGPERIARFPVKDFMAVNPPSLCMKLTLYCRKMIILSSAES